MFGLRCMQIFGQFAQSDVQRNFQLFKTAKVTVKGAIKSLSRLTKRCHALTVLLNDMTEEFVSADAPIDSSGSLVSTHELIRDSYGKFYALLRSERDTQAHMLSLPSHKGLLEAYEAALKSVADVHNALNDFCWAIGEHDADFEKPTGKNYTNAKEMFRDMGV